MLPVDSSHSLPLLGGLTPQQFMRHYWQRKPLLVRQALPGFKPLLSRAQLFGLAADEAVESRLVVNDEGRWRVRQGPFSRRQLPSLQQRDWTLLLQGVDLHVDAVHALLQQFRFVPDARLDDLMVSYATPGGGVGPHFDSYDVFLLQAQGQRRWRISSQRQLALRDDVPLKILAHFEPEQTFVLQPGDMLYLPPRYAHDGVAESACMTYSVGFRAPAAAELARELLLRLADDADGAAAAHTRYRDATQAATNTPAEIVPALADFARQAVQRTLTQAQALDRALGEYLTEPKAKVWFDAGRAAAAPWQAVRLDRRSRMMYDATHVYLNGESWRAAGRDARLMRLLADRRGLDAPALRGASAQAVALLQQWCEAGWLHAD